MEASQLPGCVLSSSAGNGGESASGLGALSSAGNEGGMEASQLRVRSQIFSISEDTRLEK